LGDVSPADRIARPGVEMRQALLTGSGRWQFDAEHARVGPTHGRDIGHDRACGRSGVSGVAAVPRGTDQGAME